MRQAEGRCRIGSGSKGWMDYKQVDTWGEWKRYFSTRAFGNFVFFLISLTFFIFSLGKYWGILMRVRKYRAVCGKRFHCISFPQFKRGYLAGCTSHGAYVEDGVGESENVSDDGWDISVDKIVKKEFHKNMGAFCLIWSLFPLHSFCSVYFERNS